MLAPDAVADQRADDREPGALDARLDRVRDVAQAVAGPALRRRRRTATPRSPSSSFAATGVIRPTGNVRAASATQPSSDDADVDREMSPRCRR